MPTKRQSDHDGHDWGEHSLTCTDCAAEKRRDRRAQLARQGPSTLGKHPAKSAAQLRRWGAR